MRLNFVLGTAAELIKVYPLIQQATGRGFEVHVISTGQSRENFLMQYRDFGLSTDAMTPMLAKTSDLENAGAAFKWFLRAIFLPAGRLKRILHADNKVKNFVVVHGDTLSTLVGALLGRRCGLPVVHVEAGLRSPSLFRPFPEEITRRLVSRLVTYHFVPDERAETNLKNSYVGGEIINTGGNTLMDAVRSAHVADDAPNEPFVLVNIHRFENINSSARWDSCLRTVLQAAKKMKVIFIAHPQTRHKLEKDTGALALLHKSSVDIRERMPFSKFMGLLHKAQYLISDGGSNQEECSYLGKPCLLMRDATERQEGLGTSCVLSCFDEAVIQKFLENPAAHQTKPASPGRSPSEIILDKLSHA